MNGTNGHAFRFAFIDACDTANGYLCSALRNVVAISSGFYHTLALIGDRPPVLNIPLSSPVQSSNTFSLSVPTRSGRVYGLEFKNSLADPIWTALPLNAGDGNTKTLIDPTATAAQRFYRVRAW